MWRCSKLNKNVLFSFLTQCYYPHTLTESVSPVCRIFLMLFLGGWGFNRDAKGVFKWYRCFYPHRSRELESPICGIFCVVFEYNKKEDLVGNLSIGLFFLELPLAIWVMKVNTKIGGIQQYKKINVCGKYQLLLEGSGVIKCIAIILKKMPCEMGTLSIYNDS